MKYAFVILGLTILSLYAVLDNRLKAISLLQDQTVSLKAEISMSNRTVNTLEDYRQTLKPPDNPPLGWPVEISEFRYASSYYGFRNDPLRRNTGGNNNPFHPAVDIVGIEGARVDAVADGIVLHKYYEAGIHFVDGKWREYSGHDLFNGYIVILHDNGMISHSGHVAEILVHEGDRVEAGQQIAQISQVVDSFSTGPHLDFRLQDISGNYVNPLLWIGREQGEEG